jgi:hypothetical protein
MTLCGFIITASPKNKKTTLEWQSQLPLVYEFTPSGKSPFRNPPYTDVYTSDTAEHGVSLPEAVEIAEIVFRPDGRVTSLDESGRRTSTEAHSCGPVLARGLPPH